MDLDQKEKAEFIREQFCDQPNATLARLFDHIWSGFKVDAGELLDKMLYEDIETFLIESRPAQRDSDPVDESRRQDAKAGNYQLRRMYRK